MTFPKRILEDDDPSLEGAELLRSTLGDEPSPAAERRTLAALGLIAPSSPVSAPPPLPVAPRAAWQVAARWLALAALGGGVAALALRGAGRAERPIGPPEIARGAPARVAAEAPRAEEPAPSEVPAPIAAEALPLAEPAAPASAGTRAAAGGATASLADEVRRLAQARGRLQAGDAAGALAALDAYRADFPRGSLRTEAAVLRVEALARQGQRSAAVALAKRLLAAPGGAAYAQRLRSLLPELAPAPASPSKENP
ncbi:MAG: hypothetical protein OZ928_00890 [Polyangiaceae bacterium]|nr:hypothetical protein [Polyangiaceae bacterium]